MKAWFDTALAWLAWGWEKLVALAKTAWGYLRVAFDTVYDPPPRTIRFFFWSFLGVVACVWLTFAFVNSWFYKPTVKYLASFSWGTDDLDVVLPEHVAVLPPVAPAAPILQPVKVCEDMSDTPRCVPAKLESEGTLTYLPEKEVIPLPVAKPKLDTKKKIRIYRREHKPYETVWGF